MLKKYYIIVLFILFCVSGFLYFIARNSNFHDRSFVPLSNTTPMLSNNSTSLPLINNVFVPLKILFKMNKNLPQSTDTQTVSFFVVINSKIIFEQKITQCKKSHKVCKELDTSEIYSSRYALEDYGAKIIKPNALAKKFNRDKDIFYIKINYKNSDKVFIRAVNKVKSGFETSIPGYINFPFVITEGTKSQKLELTTDTIGHFLSNFSVY